MAQLSVLPVPNSTFSFLLEIKDSNEDFHEVCDYDLLLKFANALSNKAGGPIIPFPDSNTQRANTQDNSFINKLDIWFKNFSEQHWMTYAEYHIIFKSQKKKGSLIRSISQSPSKGRRLIQSSFLGLSSKSMQKSFSDSATPSLVTPDILEKDEAFTSLVDKLESHVITKPNSIFEFKGFSEPRNLSAPQKHYRTNSTIAYRSPTSQRKPLATLDPPVPLEKKLEEPIQGTQQEWEKLEEILIEPEPPLNGIDPESKLSAHFMEFFQSSLSHSVITESTLRGVLEYCDADHLFFIRKSHDGSLVLDASITQERTWSLLEDALVSEYEITERFEGLRETRKTNAPVYLPVPSNPNSKPSILCIPIIMFSKYRGCIYLTHNKNKNAFHHVKIPFLSMLLTNLYSLLKIQRLKKALVVTHNESLALPCLKGTEKVELQDTLQVYDSTSKKWNPYFVVQADHQLSFFNSPFEMHPKRIIPLAGIKNLQVTAQRSKLRVSNIELPVLPKSFSDYGIIYFKYQKEIIWLASELLDSAHHWCSSLNDSKQKGKPLKIPENIRINEAEVDRGEIIGKGAAAVVYEGKFQHTHVAIKQLIDQFDRSEVKSFFDEMNILQKLHHPNIVSLFGGFISLEGKPCIVFEFAMRGSLSNALYDPLIIINGEMKLNFLLQTAQALSYLHSFDPPIIHRDLKPANILINEDWTVKLADFGLARKCSDEMTTGQGTVKWMAPEVLSNAPYTTKADIYSFGLVMWEVLMQKSFFDEFKFNSQIEIQVVNHNARPPLCNPLSPLLKKLISRCWDPDPNERPTAGIVVSILTGISPTDLFQKKPTPSQINS